MTAWVLKAAIQKGITALPRRLHHPVNGLFQRYVTKGTVLSDRLVETRLRAAAGHIEVGLEQLDRPVLELGTGWFPVVPMALHICGFDTITSVDLVAHCTHERFEQLARRVVGLHQRDQLRDVLPHYQPDRVERLASGLDAGSACPASIGLELLTADARSLPRGRGHFGLITSNNVFEHIYRDDLSAILLEMARVLDGSGVMSHLVDLSDHFSHRDARITPYNFLRFTDRQWRLIDNTIQPQSRLRVDDYRSILEQTGWAVTWEQTESDNDDSLDLVPLAPRFAEKPREVVAVTRFEFTATR